MRAGKAEQRSWICCQIGAREHYAVARALHMAECLGGLVTETWVPPGHPLSRVRRLRERFHPALVNEPVYAWNLATLTFELVSRLRGLASWQLILERNGWFQRRALGILTCFASSMSRKSGAAPILFAYSYAARELLRFGKQQGWFTVLGQIDPGRVMERRAEEAAQLSSVLADGKQRVPAKYWDDWSEECALADRIVVNSLWSRDALTREGVPPAKITVIPLAYEPSQASTGFQREYPVKFTTARPLRVLFLGQVTLVKGILALLDAVRLLEHEPVEFWIVGRRQVQVDSSMLNHPQVRWIGPVRRSLTANYYREADVFVFPTFSDGFGLTQLEAQAWKLPVIASRFCGDVVRQSENGILLPEVSGRAIADVLLDVLCNPSKLADMSARSAVEERFSLPSLADSLTRL